jgi:hypothetical protein
MPLSPLRFRCIPNRISLRTLQARATHVNRFSVNRRPRQVVNPDRANIVIRNQPLDSNFYHESVRSLVLELHARHPHQPDSVADLHFFTP